MSPLTQGLNYRSACDYYYNYYYYNYYADFHSASFYFV